MIAVNRLAGLCLILTGFPILIHAQANDAEQEDRISELEKAEGQDPERLAAIVELQAEKPDVNLLHHETLSLLPCLTTAQTEALLAHRSRHGPILCVEELAAVTGFDPVTIDCMMRHVEFPERFTMPDQLESDFARHLSLEVTGNINRKVIPEENAGNAVTTNGDAYRSALRIRMAENSGLKAGINLEKDAYEPWWSERGTDHTGWYLDYAPSKKHIRLIVGDYSPGIGQGVLFGRNSFGGTGGDVTGLVRVSAGIRPHSAMSENGYLKGIAVDYRMKKFELIGFGSYLKTDGRITWSDDSLTKYFNEDRSGYHRTLSEATYAATGHTVVFGGRIGFEQGGMTAGITACNLHNAWPAPPADEPYAYFRKQEKEQSVFSVDYRRVGGQTLLFGETAMDSKGSSSTCTGVLLHPDRNVAAGLLFRHRGRGFSFPFANPTGFATEGAGETGLLTLFNIRLDDRFALQLSFDRYSVAWLGYDRNSLSRGGSETARLLITKGKSSEAVLQLRFIHATISTDTDERMEGSIAGSSMQFRAQVIHRPGFGVQFKTRLETRWDRLQSQTPPSVLAFHEIKSRFRQLPVTALIRLSIFRTTGYADAIYSQDSMPLYQFGSTMNYGTGWRNYLMLKIDLSRSLDLWMRICHTKLFDRRMEDAFSGGDGTASLESNLQLRWRLH